MRDTLRFINGIYARHGLMLLAETGTRLDELIGVAGSKMNAAAKGGAVQVITPLGPCREFLATTARSLASQTQPCDWWLVADGATPARSGLPIGQPRLGCEIALGAYGARNQGLKHVTGDFITVHDADDWSHPQKLEIQVKALLDNPKAMASVSHWARCSTDLQLETRPDGSVVHRNVSSLMIRREVFERLGFWDRVSVNADTEYYYRILSAYGPDSIVEVMPGVPLALGRRHSDSLTMQPETHWRTQFGGVRQEYMDAAHAWHRECERRGDWYMPYAPSQRPFPVPALIDRPVIELGDRVWPHLRGEQSGRDGKTVLLCGHAAAQHCFGAERSLLDLAAAIDALGYRLVVTLPERGDGAYLTELKAYCSDIVLLPAPWRQDDAWPVAIDAYQRLIRHFDIDLIHVNTLVNLTPLHAARQMNVPAILHVRELPHLDLAIQTALAKDAGSIRFELLQLSTHLVANSRCTAGYLTAPDQTTIIPNMVALKHAFDPVCLAPAHPLRVGMISSNLPKKGIHDFVSLANMAHQKGLDCKFYLIGPNNQHTASLGADLPANLQLFDYSPTPDEALSKLDVVVNLSHFQESFGRTIAEGMLAGRIVIGYRWGALPELIDNGINGFLVQLGDIEGIILRLQLLRENPDLVTSMATAAQKKARAAFDINSFKNKLSNLYTNLLR